MKFEEEERKCKNDLLRFAVLCVFIFIVTPIALVICVRYSEEIDTFFDFKTQVLAFLFTVLCGTIWFLIRWYKR